MLATPRPRPTPITSRSSAARIITNNGAIVPSPNDGPHYGDLTAGSCESARSCEAAGFRDNGTIEQTLIESVSRLLR